MRFLIVFCFQILVLVSCFNRWDDNTGKVVTGKWKLTEEKISSGGIAEWKPTQRNFILQLNADKTFVRNDLTSCLTGTYTVFDAVLLLQYDCNNNDNEHQFRNKYTITSLSNSELILQNKYCIEECSEKFTKVE